MPRLLVTMAAAAVVALTPALAAPGKSGSAPNQSQQGVTASAKGQEKAQEAGNPCKPNPKGPGGPKGKDCHPVTPNGPKK
ncbi:MAG TPA: hypothetical protein VF727_03335 [Allosphingosinicella sp.]|jgi:hypothetical protein